MLCATIAARRVLLEGCDTMRHADKFSRFADDHAMADFRMTVSYRESLDLPQGKTVGEHNTTRWIETENGERWLLHSKGDVVLSYNDTFSENHLFLRNGIDKADILHYLYVSQCFSYHMLSVGGCSLHASGIRSGDSGIALCGRSGTGKSTLTRLWMAADPRVRVLSEDAPAVTAADDVLMHGTPFCGDDDHCCRETVPLRGIVLLKRGTANTLTAHAASQKLFWLLDVLARPVYHRQLAEKAIDIAQNLVLRVPVFVFEHDATPAAFAALQAALKAEGLI